MTGAAIRADRRKVAEGGFEQPKQGILVLKVDVKGKYCDKNPGK